MDSLEGNHAPPTFWKFRTRWARLDGKHVDMIYMDMSKAFVKVNRGCLLQKFTSSDLEAASRSGLALTWWVATNVY